MGGGIGGGGMGCCIDIIGGGMFPGGIPGMDDIPPIDGGGGGGARDEGAIGVGGC